MKYYSLQLIICLVLCTLLPLKSIAGSNSCIPEGIRFTSQRQIDSFRVKFPDCTLLLGDVILDKGDITHLDSLKNITSISGDLHISAELLADLTGLDNLSYVSGDIFIGSYHAGFSPVQSIVSLQGLNSLTQIGGNFEIVNCNLLVSMEGLENLTTVNGHFKIWGNDKLESMDGLNNLRTVSRDFIIGLKSYHALYPYGNPALKDLSSLTSLEKVGGTLQLAGNRALRSLEGLNGLRTIGGSLALMANDNLVNLVGLDNLQAIGGSLWVGTDGWWIENGKNTSLTDLRGLHSLEQIGEDVLIFGGQSMNSLSGLNMISTLEGNLVISGEGIASLSGLESLKMVRGNLSIHAGALVNFEAFRNLILVQGDLNISGCNMLASMSGLFSLKKIGGSLLIYDNYRLQTLTGLGEDLHIDGDVRIGIDSEIGGIGNKYLTDISSLRFLEVVNGSLQVTANASLSSLAGLDRVTEVRETLCITENPNLQTCNIPLLCEHISSGKESIINRNATGCDNVREILQSCNDSILEYTLEEEFTAVCFPNPTSGNVHIKTSTKSPAKVVVLNQAGMALEHNFLNGDSTINLAEYAEGMYYLRISNENSVLILPVVKNSF